MEEDHTPESTQSVTWARKTSLLHFVFGIWAIFVMIVHRCELIKRASVHFFYQWQKDAWGGRSEIIPIIYVIIMNLFNNNMRAIFAHYAKQPQPTCNHMDYKRKKKCLSCSINWILGFLIYNTMRSPQYHSYILFYDPLFLVKGIPFDKESSLSS